MLNAGVHPVVPAIGSVGAGDLGQMASMALVAIGSGTAELAGDTIPGGEALRRAGIVPLTLEPKDGLAFFSANAVAVGHAAFVADRAVRAAELADAVAAVSMEATRANPSVFAPVVGRAKPFAGQIESCRHLSDLLTGSDLLADDGARSVQDALSFRVVPQVHGAFRDMVAMAWGAVETELNGCGDNPLVDIEARAIVHNGNFHPVVLAIAFDAVRVAMAHVGQLSDRRMSHLWAAFFAAAPGPRPAGAARSEAFGLALRYPAAAVAAELTQLAAPATLDVAPLDLGVETTPRAHP